MPDDLKILAICILALICLPALAVMLRDRPNND